MKTYKEFITESIDQNLMILESASLDLGVLPRDFTKEDIENAYNDFRAAIAKIRPADEAFKHITAESKIWKWDTPEQAAVRKKFWADYAVSASPHDKNIIARKKEAKNFRAMEKSLKPFKLSGSDFADSVITINNLLSKKSKASSLNSTEFAKVKKSVDYIVKNQRIFRSVDASTIENLLDLFK